MIEITDDYRIYSNRHEITDLKKPFNRFLDLRTEKRAARMYENPPNITFKGERLKKYWCKLAEYQYGSLYRSFNPQFRCHSLYSCITTVPTTHKVRVLEKLLTLRAKAFNSLLCAIDQVFQVLIKSYDFDYIITDFPIKTIIQTMNISQCFILKPIDSILLQRLLISHRRVPLKVVDSSVYSKLSLEEHTNLKVSQITGKKILVLIWTNSHLAYFLANYFHQLGKEALPVTVFMI